MCVFVCVCVCVCVYHGSRQPGARVVFVVNQLFVSDQGVCGVCV